MTGAPRPPREIDGRGRAIREHIPECRRFAEARQPPTRAHDALRMADVEVRQALVQRLAERTWKQERLDGEAAS